MHRPTARLNAAAPRGHPISRKFEIQGHEFRISSFLSSQPLIPIFL
jgi:hypothetical protein